MQLTTPQSCLGLVADARKLIHFLLRGKVKEGLENHACTANACAANILVNAQSLCVKQNVLHVALMLRAREVIAVACVVFVATTSTRRPARRASIDAPPQEQAATIIYATTKAEERGHKVMRRLIFSLLKKCNERRVKLLTILSATPADSADSNWWRDKAGPSGTGGPNPDKLYFNKAVSSPH